MVLQRFRDSHLADASDTDLESRRWPEAAAAVVSGERGRHRRSSRRSRRRTLPSTPGKLTLWTGPLRNPTTTWALPPHPCRWCPPVLAPGLRADPDLNFACLFFFSYEFKFVEGTNYSQQRMG